MLNDRDQKQAVDTIALGLRNGIHAVVRPVARLILIILILTALFTWWTNDYDSTDGANGRSGMQLFIDAKTGCQYVGNPNGGITPRLNKNGQQICAGYKWENK